MKIEILGTESLGVRGSSCFIETKNRKILIDPGIALGYIRHRLLPHPFQIAIDERIQKKIIDRWHKAYAKGEVSTDRYWNLAKKLYKHLRLNNYYND